MTPKFRVARPTDRMPEIVRFYRTLGMLELGSFADHDGFDGLMLGWPDASYHLEFTQRRGHPAQGAPSDEHLLVFYLPDRAEWQAAADRMRQAGYAPVPPGNPYWAVSGLTFADAGGYRIVLQNAAWTR